VIFDLSSPRAIHVLGASGPGMSAIARILARMGHRVSGCDVRDTPVLRGLEREGVRVDFVNDIAHVASTDAVTHSSAIAATHPEIEEAQRSGTTVLVRADMLAAICATRRAIGVAGTHGKTTTSAMLATILVECGLDPGYVIGGEVPSLGSNAQWGEGEFLVVEADESDSTHLKLPLAGAILTNVDVDHLDNFGSFAGVVESFAAFVDGVSGPVVMCADDPTCASMAQRIEATLYGIDSGDVRAVDIEFHGFGSTFGVVVDGETHETVLAQPGRHNVLNALAAIAMATRLGVPVLDAISGLRKFTGVERRFELRGEASGVVFVDDYAHLPAEIAATLAAAKNGIDRRSRVVAVFQPNRFHRIATMADEYAGCFADADLVVVTDIYASGTRPIEGVSGRLVVDAVRRANPDAKVEWCQRRDELPAFVDALLVEGDLCVSMGCGDIESLPAEIIYRRAEAR
jgi:UDP-N-acetylmuramate--alanine ligase